MAQLRLLLAASVLALAAGSCRGFEFLEATVDAIQLGFKNGSLTSTELVRFYLDQISRLNPNLHAVIEVNPDALDQAARADAERSSGSRDDCGGLHGIPILLKDNIATRDRLNTTAGSFALLGSVVKRDAGVVSRLRRAGAVVLGKANLDEWASYRSDVDLNGWSARGGMALNPYVLSAYTCGSSTGSAVAAAANMAAVTLGTETSGSIICPSAFNSVVGIKPSVGLTSRSGVIPITPRQDTVGCCLEKQCYTYMNMHLLSPQLVLLRDSCPVPSLPLLSVGTYSLEEADRKKEIFAATRSSDLFLVCLQAVNHLLNSHHLEIAKLLNGGDDL